MFYFCHVITLSIITMFMYVIPHRLYKCSGRMQSLHCQSQNVSWTWKRNWGCYKEIGPGTQTIKTKMALMGNNALPAQHKTTSTKTVLLQEI
jgi:hypothetical protein